jgi:nicotinate phosphoribosyltransferase
MDAFGVGTSLDVSDDAPALDIAYKLQAYAGKPRRKRSPGKVTWPGAKQVFRERGSNGEMACDHIALDGEQDRGEPLLVEVMRAGRRVADRPGIEQIRERCSRELKALPLELRALSATRESTLYPVRISAALQKLAATMDAVGD